jgi:hypothetical protein
MSPDIPKGYEKFEDIPGYKDLPPFPKGEVIFPYGMKIVEIDGKQIWQAASEQDYRTSVSEVKGIKPEDVDIQDKICVVVLPKNGDPFCRQNKPCPNGCAIFNRNGHWFCFCRA